MYVGMHQNKRITIRNKSFYKKDLEGKIESWFLLI